MLDFTQWREGDMNNEECACANKHCEAREPEQIEAAEMVAALSLQNDASLHSESGPILGRATLSPSLVIRFGRL
jgi:hypothetical protein